MTRQARLPKASNHLPPLQGLAFVFTSKGGLGLSFEHGWACVIQRLGKRAADGDAHDAASCAWSGPAFVRINNVSLGLTVGTRFQQTTSGLSQTLAWS